MTKEAFSWQQTAPGRWERDIDEVEQFYTTLARRFVGTGRTFFAMTAHVSLYIPDESEIEESRAIEALQKAWTYLRHDHPTIASWVEYNHELKRCRKIYHQLPKDNLEQYKKSWLDETFQMVTDTQSGQDWCNSDPPVPKLPTLFIVKRRELEKQRVAIDIVLRSQHDIIDGIGSLHLMGNLIRHAARAFDKPDTFMVPDFGDEWKRLSPPLRMAADIPETLTPKREARFKKIIDHNTLLRKKAEISIIPFRAGRSIPGTHQRVAFDISPDISSRILLACKGIQASVTHVYHASIAIVIRDILERRSTKRPVRYISYSLINEREHCKPPFSTSDHAAAVYHSVSGQSMAIDLDVPDRSAKPPSEIEIRREMLRVIDQVKVYYLAIKNDEEHISMVPSYWQLSTPEYPVGKEDPPVPPPNPTPSASISSLGVIDKLIPAQQGPFEIDNPWVTGEELGTGLGLFLGTFRGRMCLSAAYNDAWHDEIEVMNFIEKCHSLVLTTLGISRHE
ncbi:hypothetical protein VI817_001773 [Penicillium citrinum]|uniref:Uncharacterized protein n=1 Tax=Penicillium hetheringtonii TaxID=911720 RepID=A0AAD6H333_9EURO|nr:hypothetical protein N7450_001863 [Penicillium hetheringtonii]KAK5807515.1 hypothetical protein VI817_001773 [Penicillium citrinum]